MEPGAEHIIQAARNGDRAAVVQLIELFYERVYAFLRRLCGNDADAADLTQRTFARVWQSLPSFAGRSSASSWIHSIAHHVYVDWRRANGHTELRSTQWWEERTDTGAGPDELAARSDMAAVVYAAVDDLEPDLRETVHLHYYQGLTLDQTAEALAVATSTVKYRLRQGLAELQRKLGPKEAPLTFATSRLR